MTTWDIVEYRPRIKTISVKWRPWALLASERITSLPRKSAAPASSNAPSPADDVQSSSYEVFLRRSARTASSSPVASQTSATVQARRMTLGRTIDEPALCSRRN